MTRIRVIARRIRRAGAGAALLFAAGALTAQETPPAASAQEPVVRAVLFYSPACPHCREVIDERLPPIVAKYGDRLVIAAVDVTTEAGQALYQAAVLHFNLPRQRIGVPTLVVGSTVLVGSLEIPNTLPDIIEQGLAAGGIDWPRVPAIRQALAAQDFEAHARAAAAQAATPEPEADSAAPIPAAAPPTAKPEPERAAPVPAAESTAAVSGPVESAPAAKPETSKPPAPPAPDRTGEAAARPTPSPVSEQAAARAPGAEGSPERTTANPAEAVPPSPGAGAVTTMAEVAQHPATAGEPSAADRFRRDPVGNSAAVAVLLVLLAALMVGATPALGRRPRLPAAPAWVVPGLAALGVGVAAYLAYVEVTGAEAVCGPVGDCNAVQQSEYARLFGFLPVGVLGMAVYAALLLGWLAARRSSRRWRDSAALGLWGIAFIATLFSAYLTFLEPFVIGATCVWCLSSALVAALLLLATTGGLPAYARPKASPPPADAAAARRPVEAGRRDR